jgi:serine/threonine-protein kinase RsbW
MVTAGGSVWLPSVLGAALLPVFGGGAAVAAGLPAVVSGRPAVVCGLLAARPARVRLVFVERIADRGAYVASGRLAVAFSRDPVPVVRPSVGFVAIVGLGHALSVAAAENRRGVDARGWRSISRGKLTRVPSTCWTEPARPQTVTSLRQKVADFVVAHGVAESYLTDLRLAVSEALTNAVVHAFRDRADTGTLSLCVKVEDAEIEIVVRDDGSGMAARDDSPGLGLGLSLIRRVADDFDHREPPGGGTEVWMRFALQEGV